METSPRPLDERAFTVAEGREAGLTRGVLAGPRFDHPFYGVRARGGTPPANARDELIELCHRYAPRLGPGAFYSHESALVATGAPTPRGWRPKVHVSVYRPAMCPRTVGVVGHRLQVRERSAWWLGPLPLEQPARAWVQSATLWNRDALVVAGDFLVSPTRRLATLDQLREEAIRMRRTALLPVVDEIEPGSESPRETLLRLAVVRAGLPAPDLNWDLRLDDGRLVARLDLAWPRYRVAAEYDGRQHAFDVEQFRHDADRWDRIRSAGWELERVLDHHMRDGGQAAVAKIRASLQRRGWRPAA